MSELKPTIKNFLLLYPIFMERASLSALAHEFTKLTEIDKDTKMDVSNLLSSYDMLLFDHVIILKSVNLIDDEFSKSNLFDVKDTPETYNEFQIQQHMVIIARYIAFHVNSIIDASFTTSPENIQHMEEEIINFYVNSSNDLFQNMNLDCDNPFKTTNILEIVNKHLESMKELSNSFITQFEPIMRTYKNVIQDTKLATTERHELTNKLMFRSVIRGHAVIYVLIPFNQMITNLKLETEEINKYYMFVVSSINEFLHSIAMTPDINNVTNDSYIAAITSAVVSLVQTTMIPIEERKKKEYDLMDNTLKLIGNIKTWFDTIIKSSDQITTNPWFKDTWKEDITKQLTEIFAKVKAAEEEIENKTAGS